MFVKHIDCMLVCLLSSWQSRKSLSKYKLRNRHFSITHSKKYNFYKKGWENSLDKWTTTAFNSQKIANPRERGNTVFPSCQYSNLWFSTTIKILKITRCIKNGPLKRVKYINRKHPWGSPVLHFAVNWQSNVLIMLLSPKENICKELKKIRKTMYDQNKTIDKKTNYKRESNRNSRIRKPINKQKIQ